MRASLLCLAIAAAAATGCAHYAATPIDVAAVAATRRAASLNETSVRAELSRLAPDYRWDGGWNTLSLFAAARLSSPEIAAARGNIDAARAEARAARVAPGPTLTLTAEYAFNPSEGSPWLVGAASDFLLDVGGRRKGRVESADIAARAAEFDYAAALWKVRMKIRRALIAAAGARQAAMLSEELVAIRNRQLAAAARRVAAGESSRVELDRVRADAAIAAQMQIMADAEATAAVLDLAAAVGVAPAAIGAARIDEQLPRADAPQTTLADDDRIRALRIRTEILNAAAAYDQTETALRAAVASQLPEVRLGPGFTWERGLSKLPFALSLTLPATDLGEASIRAAEARRLEAGQKLEAAVAAVVADIMRAEADRRAAFAALDLVRSKTIPTAEAFARQADRELGAGSINRADWAAAQAGLAASRLDEVAARRRAAEAEAALEDALRQPLSGSELSIAAPYAQPPNEDQQ